jgi:hypothetical protein
MSSVRRSRPTDNFMSRPNHSTARAIGAMQKGGWDVKPLQQYHASV